MDRKVDHMNLSVIQRTDPFVTEIVDKATQVTVYAFDEQLKTWVHNK